MIGLAGLVAAALAVILGFEEPSPELLLVSGLCSATIPVALLADAMRHPPSARKRTLLRGMVGRRALRALSLYLSDGRRH